MKVAGFGFREGARMESLRAALDLAGWDGVSRLATTEKKAGNAAFQALADHLGLPIEPVPDQELPKARVATQSEKSMAIYGTGSLSEAVALLAAGPGARLVALRVISPDKMATCAIAEVAE